MTPKPKVLIVDDERLARLRIRSYLESHHPEYEVMEARDGIEAVEMISVDPPDLLFLDIEMPELNGFDVLRQLESRPFKVIFQTAYDQFALRAFEESAIDYLLKPFTDDRLEQALSRVFAEPKQDLQRIDDVLVTSQRYLERLLVSVGKRTRVIETREILYFLSEHHVTRVFLTDVDYAINHSLTYLEARLNPKFFVRLHRNSIAAVSEIASIEKGPNVSVILRNGVKLPVSRERKAHVLKSFSS